MKFGGRKSWPSDKIRAGLPQRIFCKLKGEKTPEKGNKGGKRKKGKKGRGEEKKMKREHISPTIPDKWGGGSTDGEKGKKRGSIREVEDRKGATTCDYF